MPYAEDMLPPALVDRACELYASGKVGLRGAAKLLKARRQDGQKLPISAMTMAEILRRRGYVVRESHRPSDKPPTPPQPPAHDTHAAHAQATPTLGVPWSVGAAAPTPSLPPPPASDAVLDVQPPTTGTPLTKRKLWLPDALHDALRAAGTLFGGGQKLDLDPALPPRELDRIEWEASLAWRRMLIACQAAAEYDRQWDPLPVAQRLLNYIDNADVPEEHEAIVAQYLDWASRVIATRDEKRGPQWGLYAVFCYAARAVRELSPARSFAATDHVICVLFRQEFPLPPPGFHLVGS